MESLSKILTTNKPALLFIAKFIGLYLILNTIYGLYIESYYPTSDPITFFVARNSAGILSGIYDAVKVTRVTGTAFIDLRLNNYTVVSVYEGCNGVNVLLVFIVFIIALDSSWYRNIKLLLVSVASIYLINLGRVVLLFVVANHWPESLYFFHKFFFTGIIYAWVFLLWHVWVKKLKSSGTRDSST